MDSTLPTPAEHRTANRRVGAAALAAFVALLVLAVARGPAQASPVSTPQGLPGSAPQQQQGDDDDGFRGRRGGGGGFGGPGGGPPGVDPGAGGFGGGQTAPDPGTGGGFDDGGSDGGQTPAPSAPSTNGGTTT